MTKFQVAYVPVGVPTFHLESAQKEFEKSIDLLNTITDAAIVPDKMLLSIQDLTNFLYNRAIPDNFTEYNLCKCSLCE